MWNLQNTFTLKRALLHQNQNLHPCKPDGQTTAATWESQVFLFQLMQDAETSQISYRMSWNSATARHLGRSHATCKRYNLLSPTWKCIMRHLFEGIRCQCMCNQRFLALEKLLEGTEWDYCSIWASRISLPAHIASAEKSRIFEVHSGSLWKETRKALLCCHLLFVRSSFDKLIYENLRFGFSTKSTNNVGTRETLLLQNQVSLLTLTLITFASSQFVA